MDSLNATGINPAHPLPAQQDPAKKQAEAIIALVAGAAAGAFASIATFIFVAPAGFALAFPAALVVGGMAAIAAAGYVLREVKNLKPMPPQLQQLNQQTQQLQQIVQKQSEEQAERARQAPAKLRAKIDQVEKKIEKAQEEAKNRNLSNVQKQKECEEKIQNAEDFAKIANPTREEALKFLGMSEASIAEFNGSPNEPPVLTTEKIIEMAKKQVNTIKKCNTNILEIINSGENAIDNLNASLIKNHEWEISIALITETTGLSQADKQKVMAPYKEKYEHLFPK